MENFMKKIYETDFSALNPVQKYEFMYHFSDLAIESFASYPFEVVVQTQLLIFTRWWNSYRLMAPECPTPPIVDIIIQKFWDFQEGTLSLSEFQQFTKCLSAVVLEINTGDSSELEADASCQDFMDNYFNDWDGLNFYISFFSEISIQLIAIAEHDISWSSILEILEGDLADIKLGFFEDIYEPSRYTANELKQHFQEAYNTPTFCKIIELLQKDMRTALEKKTITELRNLYKNEFLFAPEICAKITKEWS